MIDRRSLDLGLVGTAAAGLAIGLGLRVAGRGDPATWVWIAATIPVLLALLVEIATSLRRGEVGLDIVAALSMTAALIFGESLAAAVVALMYSGGSFLEAFAEGRARREMHDLLARVPRSATIYRDGGLQDVALDAVRPGDRLLIRQGDTLPVDGTVAQGATAAQGAALLDLSALTGESMPVAHPANAAAMSGATNVGAAFDLTATHRAAESTYAGIVRLVEAAQKQKAPMARMADRYSLGFLAITLMLAGLAWGLTGDPVRAVAVLVVATPCPLILAVPVALVAGLSRAAHYGVLIKGAKALEMMAAVRVLILDKTGTLTDGRPQLVAVDLRGDAGGGAAGGAGGEDAVIGIAASLDQASHHPIAQALVAAAKARGLVLTPPQATQEVPGEGVSGRVGDHDVAVGGVGFVERLTQGRGGSDPARRAGSVVVAVGIDGRMAGMLTFADPLRAGAGAFIAAVRRRGVERIVLATGDRPEVAQALAGDLGLDAIRADLTPEQKVLLVVAERKNGPVMMVGDGVNDAPALAAADLGVAMGARGAAASAEAADVVLLVDRLDRLLPGLDVARGSRRIAFESIVAGIGLSILGMIAAALGYLSPVEGALIQEAIDVGVILNALRALRIRPETPTAHAGPAPDGRIAAA